MAGYAQGGEGQFGDMSAKERSRIAKAEEEGASNDSHYQALMTHAENLFREQRFEEALERFIEARDLRPFNVYPRVKIQDLQALIARRDQEEKRPEEPTPVDPAPLGVSSDPTIQEVEPPPAVEPKVEETPIPKAPSPQLVQPPKEIQRPAPAIKQETPRLQETPAPMAEGERIYKEGRAVVVERSTTVEGKAVIFRKVLHPWGEVMYFRDGASIPERIWIETFGPQ